MPQEATLAQMAAHRHAFRTLIHTPLAHTQEAAPVEDRTCPHCRLCQTSTEDLTRHINKSKRCLLQRASHESSAPAPDDTIHHLEGDRQEQERE